jgi:hypothetical protein
MSDVYTSKPIKFREVTPLLLRQSPRAQAFHQKLAPRIRTGIYLEELYSMAQGNAYNELLFKYVTAESTSLPRRCKSLSLTASSLRLSGAYSDLTITCGALEAKVHKCIVCPQSEFFKKACENGRWKVNAM